MMSNLNAQPLGPQAAAEKTEQQIPSGLPPPFDFAQGRDKFRPLGMTRIKGLPGAADR